MVHMTESYPAIVEQLQLILPWTEVVDPRHGAFPLNLLCVTAGYEGTNSWSEHLYTSQRHCQKKFILSFPQCPNLQVPISPTRLGP
jgi:hypothetical protein